MWKVRESGNQQGACPPMTTHGGEAGQEVTLLPHMEGLQVPRPAQGSGPGVIIARVHFRSTVGGDLAHHHHVLRLLIERKVQLPPPQESVSAWQKRTSAGPTGAPLSWLLYWEVHS